MIQNIGFISTRFAGTDGVSLEASKWAEVFQRNGYSCYWFAGKLDRDLNRVYHCPEAYFQHEKNQWISEQIFGTKRRHSEVTAAIHELRSSLKEKLHQFINHFKIDLLIAENALTIPMHVPLGLALTEVIAETTIPTIAHHHDFYWERIRFSINSVNDYIRTAFPPNLPDIHHVVINSEAREQLALRTGITSTVIPNVLDFENSPVHDPERAIDFKRSIGLAPDDVMILQPTRIIQRKGIEYAIELIKELKDPRCKLVISHEAGDEGYEYAEWLKDYARDHQVDLRLVTTRITDPLAGNGSSNAAYTLWDVYPFADFITYPSLMEGFGNAFLEAIYFKKPLLVNRYATFVRDIEPLGFDLAVMDGFLSRKTVANVCDILHSREKRERMVEHNYQVATCHYSYDVLVEKLNSIIAGFFGRPAALLQHSPTFNRKCGPATITPLPPPVQSVGTG